MFSFFLIEVLGPGSRSKSPREFITSTHIKHCVEFAGPFPFPSYEVARKKLDKLFDKTGNPMRILELREVGGPI